MKNINIQLQIRYLRSNQLHLMMGWFPHSQRRQVLSLQKPISFVTKRPRKKTIVIQSLTI